MENNKQPEIKKNENRFERTLELHKETKAKADEERRKTNEVQKKAREAQNKTQSREQSRTQSRTQSITQSRIQSKVKDVISGKDILNDEYNDIFLRNLLSPELCKTNMCHYYDAPCQCWSTTKEKDRKKEIKCLLWEITNERGEKVTRLEKKVIEKRDRMRYRY